MQAIDGHLIQHEMPAQEIDLFQPDIEALPADQGPTGPVGQGQVMDMELPGQAQGLGLVGGLGKNQLEFGIHRPALDGEGHRGRHVGLEAGQIEVIQIQVQFAVVGGGKGGGTASQLDLAAVEMGGEQGLDLDFRLVGQAGDEGDADLDVAQGVGLVHRAVGELHQAAADLDVIQRKPGRRSLGGFEPFVEQIGDVVTPLGQAGHPQARLFEAHLVDDHAPVSDGGQGQVHVEAVETEDLAPPLILDRHAGQAGRQGVGIDIDLGHRHLAMQLPGKLIDEEGFGQGRRHQEAEDAKGQDETKAPGSEAPRPPGQNEGFGPAKLLGPGNLGRHVHHGNLVG